MNSHALTSMYTVAQDNGEPQCVEWVIEHRALHQAVDHTTMVLILMLVLSWVAIQTEHRS
jgi:hypothetical protein